MRAVSHTWCLVFTISEGCLSANKRYSSCLLFKDMWVWRRKRISLVSGCGNRKHKKSVVSGQFGRKWVWVARSFANIGHLHYLTALLASSVPHRYISNASKMLFPSGQHWRVHIAQKRYHPFDVLLKSLIKMEQNRRNVIKSGKSCVHIWDVELVLSNIVTFAQFRNFTAL